MAAFKICHFINFTCHSTELNQQIFLAFESLPNILYLKSYYANLILKIHCSPFFFRSSRLTQVKLFSFFVCFNYYMAFYSS
jgi:hypothetical protein